MKILRFTGILIVTILISTSSFAQDGMEGLVKGGAADANYLVEGYASPLLKTFATGLNQGWYNTAATHKFPGADLTISVALVGVPSSDKLFTIDNSKLSQLQLDGTSGGKGDVPTFFGPTSTNQTLSLKSFPDQKYDVPAGVDLPISRIPVPVANLGIGLPKGFDIKLRFVPTINLGDFGKLGLWGVGIMHDIKQHIPGLKSLPFSMAVFVGYTNFHTKLILDDSDPSNVQSSETKMSSTTIQALVSKKIAVLTVYGGLGYDIANGSMNLKGEYDGGSGVTLRDPVDFSTKMNSARITAGLRLKLGPITFHGDYTQAKYSAITTGFGISIR